MGIFDYRDMTGAEAADLAQLSHALAAYSQLGPVLNIPLADVVNTVGAILPDGTLTSSPINVQAPEGWSDIPPDLLGLGPDALDPDGFYTIESPLTGATWTGPQLKLMAERDAQGNVVSVAVSFAGTNSPVDILDYLQLNSGEIGAEMEPLLSALAAFAAANGLSGEDVIVTGYSLGGAMANVMARFADTLADGFFADASYVAHDGPLMFEGDDRVLNIGYENDVVHRAAGDADSLIDALVPTLPLLTGQDDNYVSSTDNIILYNDIFANPLFPLGPFSILNIVGGWGAHVDGVFTDAISRIAGSTFYDLTERDSVVIVSNLSNLTRNFTWVEDRATLASDHVDIPAFVIGSKFDDLLGGRDGGDYMDGGAGDDTFRTGLGADVVDGGAGYDTLQLQGTMSDWSVFRLDDGNIAFHSDKYGLDLARSVEAVQFQNTGWLGLNTRDYSIADNRLEDDTFSFFEWGDRDVAFSAAVQGGSGEDVLTGTRVFGLAGDDALSGTSAGDLLHGGAGSDMLNGGAGNDTLYGAEGADVLVASDGVDRMNGGQGDDVFVFSADLSGRVTIEDFNHRANEADRLDFGGYFDDLEGMLANSNQIGGDVRIQIEAFEIWLSEVNLADLIADQPLLA